MGPAPAASQPAQDLWRCQYSGRFGDYNWMYSAASDVRQITSCNNNFFIKMKQDGPPALDLLVGYQSNISSPII